MIDDKPFFLVVKEDVICDFYTLCYLIFVNLSFFTK
jgi:hypothetical protein